MCVTGSHIGNTDGNSAQLERDGKIRIPNEPEPPIV